MEPATMDARRLNFTAPPTYGQASGYTCAISAVPNASFFGRLAGICAHWFRKKSHSNRTSIHDSFIFHKNHDFQEETMDSDKEYAKELIEINLMFAQLDLTVGKSAEGATARALNHLQEALRQIRAEAAGAPQDKAPAGERTAR
jgi:hypothetical protein